MEGIQSVGYISALLLMNVTSCANINIWNEGMINHTLALSQEVET